MNVNKININKSEPTYYIASDIYDISAHNNGATFASLSALLSSENLSTLIPTSVRCGGMTIRFIQSSGNRYVQYRLAAPNWSTDIHDWTSEDPYFVDKIMREVNEAINENTPIEIHGDVTNAPDEEDLTSVNVGGTDVLKFKDKAYNSLTYSGMGRKILRKNMVNGVNTFTQNMINQANTIYVIQYDFMLGEDIIIPANCVLEFDGGSISGNGTGKDTVTGNNTGINAGLIKIFNTNVTLNGTWNAKEVSVIWFGAKGNGVSDDTNSFLNAISVGAPINITNNKCVYVVSSTLHINNNIYGNGETIKMLQNGTREKTIIRVDHKDNISIRNICLEGNYDGTSTTESEHSHCIDVLSSNNIIIDNCVLKNSKGDGIIIYPDYDNKTISKNVTITNNIISDNYRQGISIISGIDILIENNTITKHNDYCALIDCEPNWDGFEIIDDVIINNNTLYCYATTKSLWILDNFYNEPDRELRIKNIKISNNYAPKCFCFISADKAKMNNLNVENNIVNINPDTTYSGAYHMFIDISYSKNINMRNNYVKATSRSNQLFAIYGNTDIYIEQNTVIDESEYYYDVFSLNNNNNIFINDNIFKSNAASSEGIIVLNKNNININIFNNQFLNLARGIQINNKNNKGFIDRNCFYNCVYNIVVGISNPDKVDIFIGNDNQIIESGNKTGVVVGIDNLKYPSTYKALTTYKRIIYASTPPTKGYYERGSICYNTDFYSGNYPVFAWVCLSSGANDEDTIVWSPITLNAVSGNTRPTLGVFDAGYCMFDTSLNPKRPIWWDGSAWVDATGATV